MVDVVSTERLSTQFGRKKKEETQGCSFPIVSVHVARDCCWYSKTRLEGLSFGFTFCCGVALFVAFLKMRTVGGLGLPLV